MRKNIIYLTLCITLFIILFIIGHAKEILILKNSKGYDKTKQVADFHGSLFKVPADTFQNFSYPVNNSQITKPDAVLLSANKNHENREKRIEVDLTNQKLYAFEGNEQIMSFDVSTGKWGRTPTGEFQIWIKLKYTLMTGGSKELGTYYYLPNVPYTMYFYKDFGIHGAYWHDNFGHPMSHGCVNMRPDEAKTLFYWADPDIPDNVNSIRPTKEHAGTKVIIYGVAPNN